MIAPVNQMINYVLERVSSRRSLRSHMPGYRRLPRILITITTILLASLMQPGSATSNKSLANLNSGDRVLATFKCIIPKGESVTYRNSTEVADRVKSGKFVSGGDLVDAVFITHKYNWFKTIDGLWLPISFHGDTYFKKVDPIIAVYKCVVGPGYIVDYRNSKDMMDLVKTDCSKQCGHRNRYNSNQKCSECQAQWTTKGVLYGDIVKAVLVENDWLKTNGGLWLPITKEGYKGVMLKELERATELKPDDIVGVPLLKENKPTGMYTKCKVLGIAGPNEISVEVLETPPQYTKWIGKIFDALPLKICIKWNTVGTKPTDENQKVYVLSGKYQDKQGTTLKWLRKRQKWAIKLDNGHRISCSIGSLRRAATGRQPTTPSRRRRRLMDRLARMSVKPSDSS